MDAVDGNGISYLPEIDPTPKAANVGRKSLSLALVLSAIGAYMGSISMGSVLGFSSPAIPKMENYHKPLQITERESDWFGSLMNVGALIGGPIAGLLIDQLGRKTTLILVSIPFSLGYLLIAYSSHFAMLLIGRILTGLATGLVSVAVPVYIAEISPPEIRGRLSTGVQICVTIGIIYSYTVGNYIFWTWLAIACILWPALMLFIMVFLHETPFWLIKHGLPQPALKSLVFLRNAGWDVSAEFQELSDSAHKQSLLGKFSLQMLKDPKAYKPLIISLFIMIFQQFSGINAVMFYSVSIFKSAGSTIQAGVSAILIGVTQFVGTLLSSFVIDRFGRKVLLIISGAGMCISLVVFGIYFYMVDVKGDSFKTHFGWIPLVALIAYNLFFAVGYGPIPWILIGELFPLRVRGFAGGLSSGFNWFCSFLVTMQFSNMRKAFGHSGTYFFFAAFCFASCVFVVFFLPETKGRSFDEIEEEFAPKVSRVILEEDIPPEPVTFT